MENSINLFLVLLGYKNSGIAPIKTKGVMDFLARAVDPLPQAMVLASIVIGLGVAGLAIAICIRLYQHYGTFDIAEMRRLKG